ncbi:hypothetical protein [Crystallibacter degradans]|uniref:hypothetical protein n=1 Tax=Crystallibacter degradans TaxID=2726743 RepID=UPI001473F5FB|nr:hypothetical protein [Arthrobacter sp. SF27]NMR31426.1 hypothetical protein [Arthrobacter sp. SF27]
MENIEAVIAQIEKTSSLREVAQVTTFEGQHETAGTVEITISDRGFGHPYRYSVFARSVALANRSAVGRSAADLDTAIATVPWSKLGKKGR